MAKTLRVRTRAGWITKPVADIPENRLLAEEVDDNFLALEERINTEIGNINIVLDDIVGEEV